MYKYKNDENELKLLMRSFRANKRLYFLTYLGGMLLYILVLWLNFYWNPFYAGAFDSSEDSLFDKLLWSNFYLTLWHIPALLIYMELMNLIIKYIRLHRINMFFRNLIGFIGYSIYSSMAPLMLGNIFFLKTIVDVYR